MKIFAIINIILGCLIFPFISTLIMFGLSGSNPQPFIIIAISYFAIIISCLAVLFIKSFNNNAFILIVLIGYSSIAVGALWDNNFWENHNHDLCRQLQSDPKCNKTTTGFTCDVDSSLGGLVVSKSICDEIK